MDRARPAPYRLPRLLLLLCALLVTTAAPAAPEAQEPLEVRGQIYSFGGRGQIIDEVQVADETGAWDLKLRFNIILRYRWHTPKEQGAEVLIALDPVRLGRADRDFLRRIDTVLIDEPGIPVEEVRYEPSPELERPLSGRARDEEPAFAPSEPIYITVRLKQKLHYEVIPGEDSRSVTLRLYRPAGRQE